MTETMILPDTTTERLLMVADIIELTPERWHQNAWVRDDESDNDPPPSLYAGKANEHLCNSTACIAGWGVLLSPAGEVFDQFCDWESAGCRAFGIDPKLGWYLFDGDLKASPADVADVLRRIAKIPEGERTLERVMTELPDDLAMILTQQFATADERRNMLSAMRAGRV